MKRPSPAPRCWRPSRTVLLTLLTLVSAAHPAARAAPRVAAHADFLRVVFDLPGPSSLSASAAPAAGGGSVFRLRLSVSLRPESGRLSQPGLRRYEVSGQTVSLTLAPGSGTPQAHIYPAGGGQPVRLVVDLPLPAGTGSVGSGPARQSAAGTPSRSAAQSVVQSARTPTRPGNAARLPALTVVIDPGHGGIDPGMSSYWVREEDVTLDVGLRVRRLLRESGVNVIMTRDHDTQLSLNKRADLEARSRLANAGRVSAYVSIHVNAGAPAASGIETYFFGQTLDGRNRAQVLRENGGGSLGEELTARASNTAQSLMGDLLAQTKLAFSSQLASDVQASLLSNTGAVNRGVHAESLYVIRNPTVPAILTEVGFGTNPGEGPRLASSSYRDRLAQGIARGILRFLKVN